MALLSTRYVTLLVTGVQHIIYTLQSVFYHPSISKCMNCVFIVSMFFVKVMVNVISSQVQ